MYCNSSRASHRLISSQATPSDTPQFIEEGQLLKERLQTFGYTASNLPQAAQLRLEEGEENHVQ